MADVAPTTFLGAGAETDDVTSTVGTPSKNLENKDTVHNVVMETPEEPRRESCHEVTELVLHTKFGDTKNPIDSVINENEDLTFSPSGNEDKEDNVSIYSPSGENKGDINASNQKTQFTTSTNDEGEVNAVFANNVTATSNAADGVAPLNSQNSQDCHTFVNEDAVESIKPDESLSEAEDGLNEAPTSLEVTDTNVVEQTSDKIVVESKDYVMKDDGTRDVTAGVTEYGGNVAGDVTAGEAKAQDKNDQDTLGQREPLTQADVGDGKDTCLEACSDVKDDCDDSFEELGELEQPLGDQIGLTGTGELGVKESNEKIQSEEFEVVLSCDVEEALSEAMGHIVKDGREEELREPIERLLCENSEKSYVGSIEQLAIGRSEQRMREPVGNSISETIEPLLNEELEKSGSDEKKSALSESQEPVLNEAQEPVLNEAHEPVLNEAQEPVLNEALERVLNEAQEPVLNKAQGPVFIGAQEQAVFKVMEQVLNEAREQLLNETKKHALNEAYLLSLTGCKTEVWLPEKKTELGSPETATEQEQAQDGREEESSSETPCNQETELVLDIPTNRYEASAIPAPELASKDTLETGESVASERAAGLLGLDRFDKDSVVPLVSEACSASGGQDSERAINQPVRKESKANFREDVEVLKSFKTEVDCRDTLPSQINSAEKIGEEMSLTSSMGAEEIEPMASDKDGKRWEDQGLGVDTQVGERTSLKSELTTNTISVVNAITSYPREEDGDERTLSSDHREEGERQQSSDDHREVGDTPTPSSDNREVGDTPTPPSDNREVGDTPKQSTDHRDVCDKPTSIADPIELHLDYTEESSDHRSRTTNLQDIPTSTKQEPEDEDGSPINLKGTPENLTRCGTSEHNAENNSLLKSHPVKDDRGICLTALKLTAAAVTGFGCAFAAPFTLAAMGFEAGGIVAGSVAAGFMSAASDSGIGLSIVSAIESVGISGLGLGAQVLIGAAGAGTAGGIIAAAGLLKRKSSQEKAFRANESPEQVGGDSDENYDENEANNNEEDESESNGEYSIEEDTTGETSDNVSADVQVDDRVHEDDYGESGKDENYPRAEATERKDECDNDDNVEGKPENLAASRLEDLFTSKEVIQGKDVDIESLNELSPEKSVIQDELYDVTAGKEKPTMLIGQDEPEGINDDLPVTSCENSPEKIEHNDNPDSSSKGGVKVTRFEGAKDDYTDNPWKDEDCSDTTY